MKKNILVLFGGVNCEHDISIISAMQLVNNLDEYLYNIFPVYIKKNRDCVLVNNIHNFVRYRNNFKGKKIALLTNDNYLYIQKMGGYKKYLPIHCCVIAMHGKNGEDGSVAGLLNLNGIPYVSSGLFGSAIGMDKCAFKKYANSLDLPVIKGTTIRSDEFFQATEDVMDKLEKTIGFPMIIKPSGLGSSIGIKVCNRRHDLANMIENALKFDNKVLVEQYLDKIKEINIAIFKSDDELVVSNIEQPYTSEQILSFNNKYIKNNKTNGGFLLKKTLPKLSKQKYDTIISVASKCYMECDFKGVVRFDFIIDRVTNKVYLNEVNTIPGSYAHYLFANQNLSFKEQLTKQINQALLDKEKENRLINYFKSDVLNDINISKFNK